MSIQKCVGMANSSLGVDTTQGTLVHSGQTNDNALCGVWRAVGQRVREEREDARSGAYHAPLSGQPEMACAQCEDGAGAVSGLLGGAA